MDLNKLISLLSDGSVHSGSKLGKAMGVTRTAIWKAIPGLQALGVPIEVIKGKGYLIPDGLDLLDENNITSSLPSQIANILSLNVRLSLSSTNDFMATIPVDNRSDGYSVCLAEMQTSGRGRRGRDWVSPFAKNISLSIGFSLVGGVEALSGLSLVVGLAVAKTLHELGIEGVGLKWPNDVYVGGKKIAGILIELSGEATTSWWVVCGVGLNVHMDEQDGVVIDQEWCSLGQHIVINRNKVVANLLTYLVETLDKFKEESFESFLLEWSTFDILKGREVEINPAGITGRVIGVNLQGALIVDDGEVMHAINAGEISVRKV